MDVVLRFAGARLLKFSVAMKSAVLRLQDVLVNDQPYFVTLDIQNIESVVEDGKLYKEFQTLSTSGEITFLQLGMTELVLTIDWWPLHRSVTYVLNGVDVDMTLGKKSDGMEIQ